MLAWLPIETTGTRMLHSPVFSFLLFSVALGSGMGLYSEEKRYSGSI